MFLVTELKFTIYYNLRCGNTWFLRLDITSIWLFDIIIYHYIYVYYIISKIIS